MSTVVNQVKGYLKWKGPGKGWNRNYFALSDYVLYAHKGKKVSDLISFKGGGGGGGGSI